MSDNMQSEGNDTAEFDKYAQEVVDKLLACRFDYTAKKDEIAAVLKEYMWRGIWDFSTSFEDETPDIRFMQEDEYDQHREEEDDEEAVTFAAGHYILIWDQSYRLSESPTP